MYTWFYGFSEEPFNINPDPKFLFLTKTHQQNLDFMVRGIKERRDFIVILGEAGSGKTTLIQHLLNTIDQKVKAVAIFNPQRSLVKLLEYTLLQLGVPSGTPNKVSLIRQLNDYLDSLAPDGTLAIIIDEAQDLSLEVLNDVCLLLTPGALSSGKVRIIFVGQPEFKAKMDSANLKELKEGSGVISQIQPLNDEECQRYIAHRLNKVESDIRKVFTPGATSLICQYSKGNPRTINVLGDNSFLIGYGLSKKKVDSDIVTQVLEDLDYVGQEERGGWQPEEWRKSRTPSTRGANPLFRKLGYSLLTLVGVGVIIFLGRTYLKGPEEPRATRFPIQPPSAKEKVALAPPEVRPDRTAKVVPKPEAEPPKPAAPAQGPERRPSVPATGTESKPPAISPAAERKPAALPAAETEPPASGKEVKSATPAPAPAGKPLGPSPAPERKIAVKRPLPPYPATQISVPKTQAETPIKKRVVAQAGDSLYTIAARTYNVANTSVVDYILESNPWIAHPNKLLANQTIRLPEISEESLIIEASDGTCRIRLGTFLKPEYSTFLKGQPPLQGKMIEVVPRKLPSGETWYRAVAGKFGTREEGLRVIRALKGKGLSPYFAGFKKSR